MSTTTILARMGTALICLVLSFAVFAQETDCSQLEEQQREGKRVAGSNAMQMIAEGSGVGVTEMLKHISNGEVDSGGALDRLMLVMRSRYRGAAITCARDRGQVYQQIDCSQLAEIGSNAYATKKGGMPMDQVLQMIGHLIQEHSRKRDAAQGVIIAIYGDSSIKSSSQAHNIVYSACKRRDLDRLGRVNDRESGGQQL